MADDRNLVDLELVEQRRGVAGELVEMEIESWLRGFIEADLVRRDDAIARAGQRFDLSLPIARGEVPPMQQEDSPPIRLAIGRAASI